MPNKRRTKATNPILETTRAGKRQRRVGSDLPLDHIHLMSAVAEQLAELGKRLEYAQRVNQFAAMVVDHAMNDPYKVAGIRKEMANLHALMVGKVAADYNASQADINGMRADLLAQLGLLNPIEESLMSFIDDTDSLDNEPAYDAADAGMAAECGMPPLDRTSPPSTHSPSPRPEVIGFSNEQMLSEIKRLYIVLKGNGKAELVEAARAYSQKVREFWTHQAASSAISAEQDQSNREAVLREIYTALAEGAVSNDAARTHRMALETKTAALDFGIKYSHPRPR